MRGSTARRVTVIGACGLAALLVTSSASAAPAAITRAAAVAPAVVVNWGQDGYNKGDTGYNPYETAITQANVSTLTYKWSITSPVVRQTCMQQNPPLVDNGRLFLSDQGGFAAYNATTGAPEWTVRDSTPDEDVTPILAASGSTVLSLVIDCISQSDPPSTLTAYNAATGAPLWHVDADPAMFSVAIDGSTVIVGGSDADGTIAAAYNLATGAAIWSRDDVGASLAISAGGNILTTYPDGTGAIAIKIATGAVAWTTAQPWSAVAASADGTKFVVIGAAGGVSYVNAATGALLWTSGVNAQCQNLVSCEFIAADTSHVYVKHGDSQDQVTALKTSNGTVAWTYTADGLVGRPVVADGIVYVPVSDSSMVLLKATTGAVIDDNSQYQDVSGHAVVVNGWLYVTNGRVLDAFHP